MIASFLFGLSLGIGCSALVAVCVWISRRSDRLFHATLGLPVKLADGKRYYFVEFFRFNRMNWRVVRGGRDESRIPNCSGGAA